VHRLPVIEVTAAFSGAAHKPPPKEAEFSEEDVMAKIVILSALALAITVSTVVEVNTFSQFEVADSCGAGDC